MTSSIMQLPDDVLKKILEFIPERFELAQVCKKFYELISELEKNSFRLKVGIENDESIHSSIMKTRRVFDNMSVCMEFRNEADVAALKAIFQQHGSNIKKLSWVNWSSVALSEGDFVEMLNFMPNLEELELGAWSTELTSTQNLNLKLPKLRSLTISECQPFIIDFLNKILPPKSLLQLNLKRTSTSGESLKNFIGNQMSITELSLDGFVNLDSSFEALKLTHLRVMLFQNETPLEQKASLRALIKSQSSLKSLDTYNSSAYCYSYVDEAIFREICEIKSLESLKINIDGVPSSCIQSFGQLTSLKSFETQTCLPASLETFKELSLIKNVPLEHLTLHLWTFEIPAETYQNFGANFPLKSLKITLGTWHKVNFFIKSFPNLESLSVRFGEANNTVDFNGSFIDDGSKNESIKCLNLEFNDRTPVDADVFGKMLKAFPKLEKLRMQSNFPFSSEFFNHLESNLGKLRELSLVDIKLPDDNFAVDAIESLQKLSRRLRYCYLMMTNIEDGGMCVIDGPRPPRKEFSFDKLIEGLEKYFKIEEASLCTNVVINRLILTSGHKA